MAAESGRAPAAGDGPAARAWTTRTRRRERIGYPVMLKSTAGGGGIGIRLCQSAEELDDAFDAVQRLGANNFGDSGAFLERFIAQARHVEVQIFGDGAGRGRRPGRARLLGPAPQPEGDRGDARARRLARDARAPLRRRRAARPGRQLPLGGHRRVRLRQRHRASSSFWKSTRASKWSTASRKKSPALTSWSGWCARRRATCRRWRRFPIRPAGPLVRGPAVRRGCRARLPAELGAADRMCSFPPSVRVRDVGRAGDRGHAVLRPDARQADRARRGPRRRRWRP